MGVLIFQSIKISLFLFFIFVSNFPLKLLDACKKKFCAIWTGARVHWYVKTTIRAFSTHLHTENKLSSFYKRFYFFADVVQHVERPVCDEMVAGSIPTIGSVSQVHIFGGK